MSEHLKYCMRTAHSLGVKDHPQKVMELISITYSHSTAQSRIGSGFTTTLVIRS